jgi:ABC-type glycerol-3-phosphate transport system substrate-binding protein
MERKVMGLTAPLLAVAGLLVCLMVLVQATAKASEVHSAPDSLGDPVTVVFWHTHTGDRGTLMQEFIDEFNATNPHNITIEGEYIGGYSDVHDAVIAGLQGQGPLPNTVVAYQNHVADYARYDAVRFLDEYMEDPLLGITDTADFYPGLLASYRLGQYGNQLAGLQHSHSIEVMYYNADLLSAAGLAVPTTWDEFETACISITNEVVTGTMPSSDASRFATWLWSMRQYGDQSAFGNGQTAFTFGSTAGIPYYRSGMEQGADQAWGVTHTPAAPGYEVVDSYGAGLAVLHGSEDQDLAAWLWIRWLAEREQTARWAAASGYFPVRFSAATHPSMTLKLAEDEQYAQAHALLPLRRHEPGVRGYEVVRDILGDAIDAIFCDRTSVTATLQAAAVEVDALLAESGPESAPIPPDGGTLAYTGTQGLSTTVVFPAGALGVTKTVTYVPLTDLPTEALAFALVPDLAYSRPVTITLRYRESDVQGMNEGQLKLYSFDWLSHLWVAADPCGGYVRDPLNQRFQAAVCHSGDYALMDWPYGVYLPLVSRAWQP